MIACCLAGRPSASTMVKASPVYLLGGTSFILTTITTIFNGVSYGLSKASRSSSSLMEAVVVSLSIISCTVVLALTLLWAYDFRIETSRRKSWRARTYAICMGYLFIATGIAAGGIAWSTIQSTETEGSRHRHSLSIARCVIWAISVLSQGVLCGYLLTTLTINNNHNQWPSLIQPDFETMLPSRSVTIRKGSPSIAESQRQSIDTRPQHQSSISSTGSRRSTRYSGKTLLPESKPNSIDLNPTLISYPENIATGGIQEACTIENPAKPLQPPAPPPPSHLQRSNSSIKRSLDNVMIRPSYLSSPSFRPATTRKTSHPLPKLKLPDESNIHPLFRSDSCSPPPTPTPGTMVLASPEAGQTISAMTLQRMRSTRSVSAHTPRSRSPLFESEEGEDMRPGSVLSCI
ncbi:hypothetical protein BJX99DRAFT_228516 [Aspergillus californicus]